MKTAALQDDSWIPESFREGMEDIRKGRAVSMENALTEVPICPKSKGQIG
jgi:hypothetical protein